jgi:hypothetical protein
MQRWHTIVTGTAFVLTTTVASAADFCGHLYTVCESDVMRVRFDVGPGADYPEVVGYDLYRSVLGICGAGELLTAEPWPRVSIDTTYELFDSIVTPGHKNVYTVVAVDAGRNPVDLFALCVNSSNANVNYIGCDLAPATHATVSSFGNALLVQSCDPCYPGTWIAWTWPPTLDPYIGSGIALLLYGDQSYRAGNEGAAISIESFVELPCIVAVQPTSWSQAKRLYD